MAAPPFIKASTLANVTSGTATSAFAGGNTAHNSLVVMASAYSATGTDLSGQFSDTAGNVYTLIASFRSVSAGCTLNIFFCANCKGGANSLQMTQAAGATRWLLFGHEYAPLLSSDAPSVVAQTIAATTTPSTNVIPAKVDELVLWFANNTLGGSATSGQTAGFTLRIQNTQQIFMDNANSPSAAGSRTLNCTTTPAMTFASIALAFSVPIQPVRISSTFSETLAQFDGLKFMLAPAQALLSDRVIQQDNTIAYINGGSFGDQLQQIDLLRFALIGAAAQQLFISEDLLMQDALINPNVRLTHGGREAVVLPTSGVNVRYTHGGREAILFPTAGVNVRYTHGGREVIIATPEAFVGDGNFLMSVTEDLSVLTTDTFHATMGGTFLKNFSEHLLANLADQDTNKNVNVKKNPVIKASTFVTADTSLNHWLDAIFMTPFNAVLTASDSMNTMADVVSSKLLVTLTQAVSDQTPGMTDATPVFLQVMRETFIQNLNFWQEFYAPQPFLGIFNESTGDQWQDSLAGFMPYFMPLSDSFTLTDSLTLPISSVYSDTLTLADSETALMADLMSLADALTLADSLAFNNPQAYSDSLTLTDSFTIAEELDEQFSDNLNNWADAIAEVLGTSSFQDQLVLTDSFTLGYGNFLPDQLIMSDSDKLLFGIGLNVFEQVVLSDQFGQFPGLFIVEQLQMQDVIQLPVWLSLADQLAQADSVGAGYGNGVADSGALADTMNLVESFETLLQDATPAMLENLQQLFNHLLALEDSNQMLEQLYIMYGLLVSGEFLEFDDEINVVGIVLPFLTDDAGQTWLDAILTEMVFAPSEIVVREFKMLAQILASQLDTVQEQQVDRFKTQGEQQSEFDVLLDGEV